MQPSKTILTVAKVLSLFIYEKEEVCVREVSRILDFYPTRVHCLLAALELCRFLGKDSNHRYRLGEAVLELGSLYPLHLPLRKVARPQTEELARKYKTDVQVAIPSRIRPQWRFENLFRPPADGNSFESNVRREVP